ncbi:DUF4192 domain-containing protein [Umezawaea sp. Da 62-37]|uniref:DUF4192 domain-containing protein n=1 Tax=Umezawaea sp. Da 62-37 TaxID=3075927 RepID=UPI0028F70ED2|nr:DUF4192 domain-containing protein [Umezawaea sp. Da 62-37]WNV83640.1 DUF4192 domain-containing protein [Umezawaea sp. Da 62-37]
MRTAQPFPVQVENPGDLVAALPYLLAFHPVDSLVALVLGRSGPRRVVLTLRVDLPAPRHRRALAHQLLVPITEAEGPVVLVVVGGGAADPPDSLPHRGLVESMWAALDSEGIEVACSVWTSATAHGAPWVSYGDPTDRGTVADPDSSAIAAACTAAGMVTFGSRAELVAVVAPDDDETLTRRAELLDEATLAAEAAYDPEQAAQRGLALVVRAVAEAADRAAPLADEEVVALTIALGDLWVRDKSLTFATGPQVMAAERLWTELTRATPVPERAQPATLLAFSAYLRGDGALASVALDQAELAHPNHRLATLLRGALDAAVPPAHLTRMILSASRAEWSSDGPQWS